jgi:hypothetical protein
VATVTFLPQVVIVESLRSVFGPMSNLYDAHPLRTTMGDFIEGLCRLKADTITKSRVAEFVAAAHIQAETLSPYIFWRESGYTRNLIEMTGSR